MMPDEYPVNLRNELNQRRILRELEAERIRQDAKWGGPGHDDAHDPRFFIQLIEDYAGWSRVMFGMGSADKGRRRLLQVAALAVAAIESLDRTAQKGGE